MLNKAKHKIQMSNLLVKLYRLSGVSELLGFKGGTAAMFFYGLPRFSVDLDFDLLRKLEDKEEIDLMSRITRLLEKELAIEDVRRKRFTLFWLLSYGKGERKLKLEISRRESGSKFEDKVWYGVRIPVMVWEDMVANKLMALVDRQKFASRDVFDTWYFLSNLEGREINYELIRERLGLGPRELYQKILERIEDKRGKDLLQGMGELVGEEKKNWIRNNLKQELVDLIRMRMDLLG